MTAGLGIATIVTSLEVNKHKVQSISRHNPVAPPIANPSTQFGVF